MRTAYQPDYAVSPGMVLAERLEMYELSQAEFARRCGRSPKLISDIVSGNAPVEPETAIQFERVLGLHASVWLGIEANYRLHLAQQKEKTLFERAVNWAKAFPINALVKFGFMTKPENDADKVGKLLSFFGVGSLEAWHARYSELTVTYRRSPSFKSSPEALSVWLRIGEIIAELQNCADYERSHFIRALMQIRNLTAYHDINTFRPRIQELCNEAGVAFVLVPEFPKTHLCGAARWLTPRKAIIQQSMRHKTNDHFWFTFFHEAAHILLHSKKDVFVDEKSSSDTDIESEANAWTKTFLVPESHWRVFVASRPRTANAVKSFAKTQGLHPGIIVGMLQHEGEIEWSWLNNLKARYEWGIARK